MEPPRRGGAGRLALNPIAALQDDNKARLQAGGGVPLIGQNNILRIYYGFLTHNLRMNAAIHGQAENDIREKMLFYTP